MQDEFNSSTSSREDGGTKAVTSGDAGFSNESTESARSAAMRVLREKGSELGKAAGGRIERVAADGKDTVAARVGRIAAALRAAGEAMQDQEAEIANYPIRFADHLDRFSTQMSERDVRALLMDVESFARRRPEIFLGGVLLAGVVVGRFLRASAPDSPGRAVKSVRGAGIQSYRRSYRGQSVAGTTSDESGSAVLGTANYASDRDYADAGHESDFRADGSSKSARNDRNSGSSAGRRATGTRSGTRSAGASTRRPAKIHGDALERNLDE